MNPVKIELRSEKVVYFLGVINTDVREVREYVIYDNGSEILLNTVRMTINNNKSLSKDPENYKAFKSKSQIKKLNYLKKIKEELNETELYKTFKRISVNTK